MINLELSVWILICFCFHHYSFYSIKLHHDPILKRSQLLAKDKKSSHPSLPNRGKNNPPSVPKEFIRTNIHGRALVVCRPFSIDGPKKFQRIGSYTDHKLIPKFSIPEIAFIGRSNVGKSSLINCLTGLNNNIALTSKTPGRTQSINLIRCSDKDGDICILTDLPGYGYAKISKDDSEAIMVFVNKYLVDRSSLKVCVVLVDARREPQKKDFDMIKFLAEEGIPYATVITKSDLVSKTELSKLSEELVKLYQIPPVIFSAKTGSGKKDLWRLISRSMLQEGMIDAPAADENAPLTADDVREALPDIFSER
jgi:GTP-binding protein